MKKRYIPTLLVLGSMLALAGSSAGAASAALPELVNKNGTEPVYGFFTTSSSTPLELEGKDQSEVGTYCTGYYATGLLTGTKTSRLNVTLTGCTWKGNSNYSCSSPGRGGSVRPSPLVGKLVYLDAGHTKVGWAFEPATKNGVFAEVSCTAQRTFKVGVKEAGKGGLDTLLGEIKGPYKVKTYELQAEYQCVFGQQKWVSYFEGSLNVAGFLEDETAKGVLETKHWENMCAKSTGDKFVFEEEVELKA